MRVTRFNLLLLCVMNVVVAFNLMAALPGDEPAEESPDEPSIVRLEQHGDRWKLLRNGLPYPIRGAAGPQALDLLAQCGGNSIRTWGVDDDTLKRLDEAHRNGISVALGIWIEHELKGFDFQDEEQVTGQIEKVLSAVKQYKNHPAVLLWGIGNEMEGYQAGDSPAVWSHIETLCQLVKREDPNHPVMSVIAEIGGKRIEAINRLCPSLDIIGINSYGGATSLPQRYQQAGGTKPYIVTEFGPAGPWEVKSNQFNAVIELPSNEKAEQYRATYQSLAKDLKNCLGSYAFMWGNKQEATATWFGMYLADGRKTNAVDVMSELWTGKRPENLCPRIESLNIISSSEVDAGDILEFKLTANDPEGTPLAVDWKLMPESDSYITGGDRQTTPQAIDDCLIDNNNESARVQAPEKAGIYRLYAIASDHQGAAAVANVPFLVRAQSLVNPGTKVELPVFIYDEFTSKSTFFAPRRFGDEASLQIDENCTIAPRFGKTCIQCRSIGGQESGRVAWQQLPLESGERAVGLDFTGAKLLTIWGKGKVGGVEITIGFGDQYETQETQDTIIRKETIELTRHWKKFQISLANADLRRVRTGFIFSVNASDEPVEFYLDAIAIE